MINRRNLLKQGTYAALACLTQIGASVAAAPATSLSALWSNDGGDKVTQEELRATTNPSEVVNSVWDGTTIKQFGAKNEVVSFNLVLEAATKTATAVGVTLSNLTGPGHALIRSNQTRSGNQLFNWTSTDSELFFVRYLQIKGLSSTGYGGYSLRGTAMEPQIPAKLRLPLVGSAYTGGWTDRPNHDRFYPDIAVPLELVPTFSIAAGQNQSIWADIYIPKTAPAGLYRGTVSVTENGVTTHTVPVELTVRNFALPDIPSSKTMIFSSLGDVTRRYTGVPFPDTGTREDVLGRMVLANQRLVAHRHKISLIGDDPDATTQPGAAYVPVLTGAAFTAANGYAGPGVGVGNNVYSIGTYGNWQSARWPATEAGFHTNTNAWESWFEANSPVTERFVYLSDESTNYALTQQWAEWMKTNPGVGAKLKSLATVPAPNAIASEPALNIPVSVFSAANTSTWQSAVNTVKGTAGHEFWTYNGYRPAAGIAVTEADGTDLRERAWGQYKMRVGRWFYWESTYYNDYQTGSGEKDLFSEARTFGSTAATPDPYFGLEGANGEGVMFYPGRDAKFPASSYGISGPIASLRLKHLRRGIQDIDYVTLAAAINPRAVATLVQKMVPRIMWELAVHSPSDPTYYVNTPASWSSNPDDWEATRLALANIIDGVVLPAAVQLRIQ